MSYFTLQSQLSNMLYVTFAKWINMNEVQRTIFLRRLKNAQEEVAGRDERRRSLAEATKDQEHFEQLLATNQQLQRDRKALAEEIQRGKLEIEEMENRLNGVDARLTDELLTLRRRSVKPDLGSVPPPEKCYWVQSSTKVIVQNFSGQGTRFCL